ncbi:flagellar export pore protein [Candidatus Propionivibrio aalborgensis]|uniref:Flagellar biosynthetic protein FliR n=1 Tax=Candidatus Propionivibrio aalborgensis TaxID=1860101 RepID=A0A1A8XSK5_9RHOO|nr:flagellar biosynthetic protein FliR [Candidatus Propionivibrio aalborgensis]MBK9029477.1 flagellar biosynthetic protein FliR [Propionivibrio sp.]SBT07492.1 flagellar export pore protein [Candidatus Propionivibrio aalborgensis]
MISLTTAELNAWIVAFFFPLARVLALLVAAPPFNNPAVTVRVKLLLGLAITIAIAPTLQQIPVAEPASGMGLLILAQQIVIGFAMGFSMRLVFSAVDMAGMMISNQMGLGFATAYDPQSASQTPVISEFLGVLALLIFMAINGHLMVIATLGKSFAVLPIGAGAAASSTWLNIASAGGIIFSSGVLLALPLVVAMLITNIALGILVRVAPQLNLLAIGFPVTILLGFSSLLLSLSYLSMPIQQMFEFGLQSMLGYFVIK